MKDGKKMKKKKSKIKLSIFDNGTALYIFRVFDNINEQSML